MGYLLINAGVWWDLSLVFYFVRGSKMEGGIFKGVEKRGKELGNGEFVLAIQSCERKRGSYLFILRTILVCLLILLGQRIYMVTLVTNFRYQKHLKILPVLSPLVL